MFLRGRYQDQEIDNTLPGEVEAWISRLKRIRPSSVMIYPIARATPVHDLVKIPAEELERIRELVRREGIETNVYQ
jgi:hypothetical protein